VFGPGGLWLRGLGQTQISSSRLYILQTGCGCGVWARPTYTPKQTSSYSYAQQNALLIQLRDFREQRAAWFHMSLMPRGDTARNSQFSSRWPPDRFGSLGLPSGTPALHDRRAPINGPSFPSPHGTHQPPAASIAAHAAGAGVGLPTASAPSSAYSLAAISFGAESSFASCRYRCSIFVSSAWCDV
jgi:hypothetical protein